VKKSVRALEIQTFLQFSKRSILLGSSQFWIVQKISFLSITCVCEYVFSHNQCPGLKLILSVVSHLASEEGTVLAFGDIKMQQLLLFPAERFHYKTSLKIIPIMAPENTLVSDVAHFSSICWIQGSQISSCKL
jgi:hypothetical protein